MSDIWTGFIKNIAFLSFLLLIATLIRSKVKFLQNFFVPNSIIAGFLGLILGTELLGVININISSLKDYIYHFLGITFIAISLHKHERVKSKDSFRTSLLFAFGYGIQAFLGFGVSLLVLSRIFKNFNPLNGILIQLGFSNSPSVANNIAKGWIDSITKIPELSLGYVKKIGLYNSQDIGLTFGAIGFLIACFTGIILIKFASKKNYSHICHVSLLFC